MTIDGSRSQYLEMRIVSGEPSASGPKLRRIASADPEVVDLFVSDDPGAPRQVVTGYRSPGLRPAGYPESLPFIPGVRVWVTEFPDGEGRTGARWLADGDGRDVADRLLTACVEDGWAPDPVRARLMGLPASAVVLWRGDEARLVLTAELADGTVVQLLSLV